MITRRRTVEELDPTSALLEVVRLAFEEGVDLADYRRSTSRTKALTGDHSDVSSPTSERGRQDHDRAWNVASGSTPSTKEVRTSQKQQNQSLGSPSLGLVAGLVTKLVPGGPCSHCSCTMTPQWRRPKGRDMVLCNACGIYFSRYNKMPPRKPLMENQSAPTEPSHAELVLRADAAGEHIGATATHGPASTTSITPAHLCDDEDLSFSHLGSKQRLPGSPANDHSNGSAVRLAKDIDMDLFHPPGSQAQHRPLMTAVFNQQPAGANFRRYLNAPPQRTASMPLLGGSESSIPLPRTSSRRREKNCRLAQYDDPSNMELADEYAQEIGSTARPACSHSGSKGGKATSAATSKLRRQRDSDGLENTSGDSDVSTGARTPNGHERRAHRTSANLSTLGPHHHVSPHAADADHAMHVVPTGNGMKLPFKENLEADAHSWAEPLQAKQESQQQVDPSPRTLPQSIPYISAPILSTHTASYVAHGSSAGSSIEDVQYLSIHPLLPFAMTLPLPFQPSAPFPGARESPPTLGSLVPSASLLPGHMSFHSPQLQQLPPVSQQQQQPNLLWQPYPSQPSSHTQVYEERSSIPEPPTPSTCTPSDSQTSTVTPQPRLIAPCRSRGPSVRSGGGILDVAETSIYGHGT